MKRPNTFKRYLKMIRPFDWIIVGGLFIAAFIPYLIFGIHENQHNPLKGNGELGKRSPFNDNKTRLYRPSLYERLGSDTNLSFRYSMNPDDEETDEGIIAKWTKNKIE